MRGIPFKWRVLIFSIFEFSSLKRESRSHIKVNYFLENYNKKEYNFISEFTSGFYKLNSAFLAGVKCRSYYYSTNINKKEDML